MRNAIILLVLFPSLSIAGIVGDGFVENRGQAPDNVLVYTYDGVEVLDNGIIRVGDGGFRLIGASLNRVRYGFPTGSHVNIFTSHGHFTRIPLYKQVIFENVYPGIDMALTREGNILEVQWFVHPGASVDRITLVPLSEGMRFVHLRAYQGTREIPVEMVRDGNIMEFRVGDYDKNSALVIDPVAIISHSPVEIPYGLNVDDSGYVYVTGFVSTVGDWDAFVSKLSPDLSTLISTAFLSTSQFDLGFSIDFDSQGNVYVAGWTFGMDFGQNYNLVIYGDTGVVDAFVVRMTPSLDSVLATARITSPMMDQAFTVQYHNDTVYVGGVASDADNFSVNPVVFGSHGGTYDNSAFVTALSADLMEHYATAIVASPSMDNANGIYVGNGKVLIFGYTYDPTNLSSDRIVYGTTGNEDAFLSVLSASLNTHLGTVIIASNSLDVAVSALMDSAGNIYVAGYTNDGAGISADRLIRGTTGGSDIFVTLLDTSLNHTGTLVIASPSTDEVTYGSDRALAFYRDNLLLLGSTDFYTQLGAPVDVVNCGTGGGMDAVVLQITPTLDSIISMTINTGDGNDKASGDMVVRAQNVYFAAHIDGSYNTSTYDDPVYFHGTPDTTSSPGDILVASFDGECIPAYRVEVSHFDVFQSGNELIFHLPAPGYLGMDVFDVSGRLVRRISSGFLPSGSYSVSLYLKPGKYILKIRYGDRFYTRRIIIE